MQIRKMAILLLLILCMTANVFAAGPLESETGSVSVIMEHNGKAVGGGSLTLYHVATPVWQEDEYVLVFTAAFADCELPLDTLSDRQTAGRYAQCVIENRIEGVTKEIDAEGRVCFEELQLGLYLLVQQEAAEGYFAASPFLITVPTEENDEWCYDVDASPKVELEKEPIEPTQPTKPTRPDNPNIPQTGQLKWPIPVLCVAGLLLFILGWIICFRRRDDKQ